MSGVPDRSSALRALALTVSFVAVGWLGAQPAHRSTQDGVYTLAQANEGKDLFAGLCQSCHTPTVHAGPPFRNKWFGHSLGELFGYIRREMPKADPGSLSDEEYALLVAYLMRINGMPTGSTPLAADSAALHRIRIDSLPRSSAAHTPPSLRR